MIISIAGPTASGKTALSLKVAELLGGPERVEIVSADAMQLYRGMDIGTAKLPVAQRGGIVHHQIDVLDIHDEASVAAYQRYARQDVADIQARGKIPLVVGGSASISRLCLMNLTFLVTIRRFGVNWKRSRRVKGWLRSSPSWRSRIPSRMQRSISLTRAASSVRSKLFD